MPLLWRMNQTPQPQRNHPVERPSRQRELALTHETINHALPDAVMAQCRQLIGQLLRQVLLAEKEVADEQ